MDQFLNMVQPALRQAMGSALGSLIVFAAIFLLILLLVVLLYFLLRQSGPGRTGITFQLGPTEMASNQALPDQGMIANPDLGQRQPTGQIAGSNCCTIWIPSSEGWVGSMWLCCASSWPD
jgi:hypothetical protein